ADDSSVRTAPRPDLPRREGSRMSNHKTFKISSPVFGDGGLIPKDHTADGRNDSPPLEWGDPPSDTRSFALVCDDPDAPRGTFVHWVLYNLPADCRQLGSAL